MHIKYYQNEIVPLGVSWSIFPPEKSPALPRHHPRLKVFEKNKFFSKTFQAWVPGASGMPPRGTISFW